MIPVNQDIDSYKDDFFKGLTMRQTLFAVAAVVVSGGLLAFFLIYLKLNASVAMYLTLPVAFPIIAVGSTNRKWFSGRIRGCFRKKRERKCQT